MRAYMSAEPPELIQRLPRWGGCGLFERVFHCVPHDQRNAAVSGRVLRDQKNAAARAGFLGRYRAMSALDSALLTSCGAQGRVCE